MSLETALAALTPEIYANLKRAIEIGKWADGRRLTAEQLENSMQLVIAWELKHLPDEQRTGYIDRGKKAQGELCGDDHSHDEETAEQFEGHPIRFRN